MIDSLFRLDGKVCVITGGSRGLGYDMAQGFLEAGAARVYITARKAEACLKAAESLSQHGECIAMPGEGMEDHAGATARGGTDLPHPRRAVVACGDDARPAGIPRCVGDRATVPTCQCFLPSGARKSVV